MNEIYNILIIHGKLLFTIMYKYKIIKCIFYQRLLH